MVKDILKAQLTTPDRSGCGTKKMFCAALTFEDVEKNFPLFTSRPLPFKSPFEEIQFFMRGRVQTKELEAKGVMFWHDQTTRSFLDSRKLNYLPEGHMGYAYGAVMRHAGGHYDENYNPVGGFDQLAYAINTLKTDPWGRRAHIELWSPPDLDKGALTPCCHGYNFTCTPDENGNPELNLAINIRSADTPFGTQANAAQFGYLLMAMAKLVGMKPRQLTLMIVDAHVYSGGYANQVPFMNEAVTREFFDLPQMEITKELHTMQDLLDMSIHDVTFHNYTPNKTKMKEKRPPLAA